MRALSTSSESEPASPTQGLRKINRHQIHLWIGEKEYRFLQKLAGSEDEPMARIVRRMIRKLRIDTENQAL